MTWDGILPLKASDGVESVFYSQEWIILQVSNSRQAVDGGITWEMAKFAKKMSQIPGRNGEDCQTGEGKSTRLRKNVGSSEDV